MRDVIRGVRGRLRRRVAPTRRTFLFAAAAGMTVVVIAMVLVVVFAAGGARRPHLLARSSASPTVSASVSATGLSIPVDDARAVVVRYLDDINTQNRTDAASLICASQLSAWQQKIDQPGGDFTVAVSRAVFHGATAAADGDALSYELDVRGRQADEVNTNTITFTVIGSPGAYQLCGES
jgi:hypothetical protein